MSGGRTAEFHARYPTFEAWSEALDRYVCGALGWTEPIQATADHAVWIDYWEAGDEPEEAIRDQAGYA